MPTHPITSTLLADLTEDARRRWYDFLNDQQQYFEAVSLIAPREIERRGLNTCLVRFIKHCDRLKGAPRIVACFRDELPVTSLDETAPNLRSWLEGDATHARIVICRPSRVPPSSRDLFLEQHNCTQLVLHELAHIARHWKAMLERAGNSRLSRPLALPQEEAEAWVMGMTVLMLAMAESDYKERQIDMKTFGDQLPAKNYGQELPS
jgi:hypothetical protein